MAGRGLALVQALLFPRVRLDRARLARAVAGKTALVTGASFGIGEHVALMLAEAGATLLLVARTADKLEAVRARIEAAGGRASVIVADLTRPDEVEALIGRLPDGIALFVSNAGKSIRRPLLQSLDQPQDVTRTIALNYVTPARLALALIPGLRARNGQIVSVSAANVLLAPAPYWAAYQASKAAFDGWLRSAEPELAAIGVAASTLYLPLVRTRMIAPTAAYHNVPAMAPEQAAIRVCRTIYTRRRRWRPWWLPPAELASLVLRGVWERIARAMAQRGLERGA